MKIILIGFALVNILFSGCSGCSKSGRNHVVYDNYPPLATSQSKKVNGKKIVIKMEKIDGVYQIPVLVDGVQMFFIFDTGASTISISETEAAFLFKQGKLTNEDFVRKQDFSDAQGNISEGTIIILKTVQLGNQVLRNITASVVHNQKAPLLFGQTAMEKFGKISIDNNRAEITFE